MFFRSLFEKFESRYFSLPREISRSDAFANAFSNPFFFFFSFFPHLSLFDIAIDTEDLERQRMIQSCVETKRAKVTTRLFMGNRKRNNRATFFHEGREENCSPFERKEEMSRTRS